MPTLTSSLSTRVRNRGPLRTVRQPLSRPQRLSSPPSIRSHRKETASRARNCRPTACRNARAAPPRASECPRHGPARDRRACGIRALMEVRPSSAMDWLEDDRRRAVHRPRDDARVDLPGLVSGSRWAGGGVDDDHLFTRSPAARYDAEQQEIYILLLHRRRHGRHDGASPSPRPVRWLRLESVPAPGRPGGLGEQVPNWVVPGGVERSAPHFMSADWLPAIA